MVPPMIPLPSIHELIQRTQALAALDLILSPEWEYRTYSFNSAWAPGERMASMRNGCGDEWWIVFHADGWAALKGLDHESQAWAKGRRRNEFAAALHSILPALFKPAKVEDRISPALQAAMPPQLVGFAREPAFRWDATSFAYYRLSADTPWVRANDCTPFARLNAGENWLLEHLVSGPEAYAKHAQHCFERPVPSEVVARVFRHEPITHETVSALNSETELGAIAEELHGQIGYPA
jgi:hypothetical protein